MQLGLIQMSLWMLPLSPRALPMHREERVRPKYRMHWILWGHSCGFARIWANKAGIPTQSHWLDHIHSRIIDVVLFWCFIKFETYRDKKSCIEADTFGATLIFFILRVLTQILDSRINSRMGHSGHASQQNPCGLRSLGFCMLRECSLEFRPCWPDGPKSS
jgi:hypothetical protein